MNSPKVSIIVPCYKVEQYLHTCIESVLHQSYENWELILVDDGSPDKSGEICDEYAKKDKRIRVIHKKNGGLSSARNAGLELMQGEYVTFLDSDDYWHFKYLEILIHLQEEFQADIVQCGFIRGKSSIFPRIQLETRENRVYTNESVFTSYAAKIIVCAKLYKSVLWQDVRMPEGKINEDDFTTWKLYYRASKIVVTSLPLYYYFANENSIMSEQKKIPKLDFVEAYKERIDFFIKEKNGKMLTMSKIQFCKSLSLLYMELIRLKKSDEKKMLLRTTYRHYIKDVMKSPLLPTALRYYFFLFNMSPRLLSYFLFLRKFK